MTKNQIIAELYTGKNFNDCINRMEPEHLRDDLRAEVIAIVCEWPAEKIIGLHQRQELDFYVVRVVLNQIRSDKSPFYYKFRQQFQEFVDHEVADDGDLVALAAREVEERRADQLAKSARKELSQSHWYDEEMVNLYLQGHSYRAIQALTKIPYSSAYKTIQRTLKDIRCRITS